MTWTLRFSPKIAMLNPRNLRATSNRGNKKGTTAMSHSGIKTIAVLNQRHIGATSHSDIRKIRSVLQNLSDTTETVIAMKTAMSNHLFMLNDLDTA